MQKAREGMGSHKHGTSGGIGPSPKAKLQRMLEANNLQKQENDKKRKPRMYSTMNDLFKNEGRHK